MRTTQVAFSQPAYRQIVQNLDAVLTFMKEEFGKTEDEAQAWMRDFIAGHYFPVWRAINRDDEPNDRT